MKKDITVIGAAIIDVLAGPVSEDIFQSGSMPMKMTRMSFGGDALNEAVVLSRMGKKVELISKVGDDEAGNRVLDYIKANGIAKPFAVFSPSPTPGIITRFFLPLPKLIKSVVSPSIVTV